MQSDAKTPSLVKRLKYLLAEDQKSEATRKIERLSNEMLGEDNFIYRHEAQQLASIDMKLLQDFVNQVADIRAKLDLDYEEAASRLGDEE
jgi:hypothetical protein